MKELIIIASLLGNYTVTSYRSVPEQTDDSPYTTSIGERVHPHGVAVSQDWLKRNGGPLQYGDWIYIEDIGFKVVNDCMHKRWTNRFDAWVAREEDEKNFHKKFGKRKLKVWTVKGVMSDEARRRSAKSY